VMGGVPGPVMVRDQFNPNPPGTKPPQTVTFTKQKSWRLCVPVNKDGLDPSAPANTSGLLCLVTGNDIDSPLKNTFVNWANQFQTPASNVHIDTLDDFCVTAIAPPYLAGLTRRRRCPSSAGAPIQQLDRAEASPSARTPRRIRRAAAIRPPLFL